MYQQRIKSGAWELERIKEGRALFSARNSGCAEFESIPLRELIQHILDRGIIAKFDEMGDFVEIGE